MAGYKSILVHLDSSAECGVRLRLAHRLAERHDAEVAAMFAAGQPPLQYPFGAMAGAAPQPAPLWHEIEARRQQQARALFEQAQAEGLSRLVWLEAERAESLAAFRRQALYADLLVLGQHDPQRERTPDVPADFVESLLIASGRPALVVPYIGAAAEPGQTVLVAWKPAREAARAVAAALPLLQAARRVHVAQWTDADGGDDGGTAPIAAYLLRHGVTATVQACGSATRDIGEHLLSLAADLGADLLVMGCYGHTRTREWVMGGATRTLLRAMTLPVLMVH